MSRPAGPIKHGTLSARMHRGCKCRECREALSVYLKAYRAKKKAKGHIPTPREWRREGRGPELVVKLPRPLCVIVPDNDDRPLGDGTMTTRTEER